MRTLISMLLLIANAASAAPVPAVCIAKAKENVEAVSRIMYAPKKLGRAHTQVLSAEVTGDSNSVIEIHTYDASVEPLHCIYRAEMMFNDSGDCWLIALTQTECSQ